MTPARFQTSVFVLLLALLTGALVLMPATALGQATTTQTPAPTAQLTMAPAKAAPGTTVTANGSGYQAGEVIEVTFNGQSVGTPTAGTEGTFALSFAVPSVSPGDYGVVAKGQTSGRSASTAFTVTQGAATLTFAPNQAPPGTSVTATGTGWQPGETVTITFNGPSVGTATADTSGNVSLTFTIPATLAPGTYGATASGDTSNRVANASFIVVAGPTPVATAVPTAGATAVPTATPVPAPGQQPVAPPLAHDDRYFSQTGYRVDNDEAWAFFQRYGGLSTFGYPVSRTITFLGCPVQFFQRQIIQVCPGQGAALMNMLDPEIFPYTRVNGSVFPGPDDAMKASTPPVSDPDYADKMNAFIAANVPDNAMGQPVNFNATFNTLGGLTIWGAPISQPTPDPSNANFVYQRFQRGIMHFIAGQGTESVLLADYLKAILLNQNVPPDLAEQSRESRYLAQYCPGNPQWLCRPAALGGTDLTFAFEKG
ncbi:MAG TPA: hypothetical protein VGL99_02310 [Chloroflexota bacterium]